MSVKLRNKFSRNNQQDATL